MSNPQPLRYRDALMSRATFEYWFHENIRFSDTDMRGSLGNVGCVIIFADTRGAMIQELMEAIKAEHDAIFVLMKIAQDYLGDVAWPATLDVGTNILSIGNSSFVMGQGMFDGERCIAIGEAVIVCIDEKTRMPRPIPDVARRYMEKYLTAGV